MVKIMEEKKFYELTEQERKEKRELWWKKNKPKVKKILFAAFCIFVCLLLFVGLLANMIQGKDSNISSTIVNMFK